MNFIDFHIGDWLKKTNALRKVERAILLDLVLAYYVQETHYVDDLEEVYRAAHADSRGDREATDYVLRKFFRHVPGTGYVNDDCEAALQVYREKQPKAEQRRQNDKERQERARERRRQLFDQLRELGITAPWDATTAQLEQSLARAQERDEHAAQAAGVTGQSRASHEPVTRDNTATSPQSPVPSPHLGVTSISSARSAEDVTAARARLTAKQAAEAMQAVGLTSAAPGDAGLLALIAQGVTVEELTEAATAAANGKKGYQWALARVRGKRQDAAAAGALPAAAAAGPQPPKGPDPALAKIAADAARAAPMPPAARELAKRLKRAAG